MTSTTQEVTAEQIALALGWENWTNKNGTWWRRDGGTVLSTEDLNVFYPYLEDSPEGYAALAEWNRAMDQHGFSWERHGFANGEVAIVIYLSNGDDIQGDASGPEPLWKWTAWYRAVQAQEQA